MAKEFLNVSNLTLLYKKLTFTWSKYMSPVADGSKTSALNPSALPLNSKAHDTKLGKSHLCFPAASTLSTFESSFRAILRCLYG